MKRLLLASACLAAFVGLLAAGAMASSKTHTVVLTATPTTITAGGTVDLAADPNFTVDQPNDHVHFYLYGTLSDCNGAHNSLDDWTVYTESSGVYKQRVTLGVPGDYWFTARATAEYGGSSYTSSCVKVMVEELPWVVSLTADPESLPVDETATLAGTVMDGEEPVAGENVVLAVYDNDDCTGEPLRTWSGWDHEELVTGEDGSFSFALVSDEPGTWWFTATVSHGDPATAFTSQCVEITWTGAEKPAPTVPVEPSSYLCWNHDMVNPVAYLDTVADQMWKTGNYFEPQAILGNVEGGTNIGAYHLVCNAPSTVKITTDVIGGSGEVYTPEAAVAYHADHVLSANDLNVYHIYK